MNDDGGYAAIQGERPMTLGIGMHDSPVAMLAWMCDKLFLWTDEYPWTPPSSSPGRCCTTFQGQRRGS